MKLKHQVINFFFSYHLFHRWILFLKKEKNEGKEDGWQISGRAIWKKMVRCLERGKKNQRIYQVS